VKSVINMFVPGVPQAKGNVRMSASGHYYDTNRRLKGWLNAIQAKAIGEMSGRGWPMLTTPVHVNAVFSFPRPLKHHANNRRDRPIRKDAPMLHAKQPDIDKVIRAVLDAMTGVVYTDDNLVSKIDAIKLWASDQDDAGVHISVFELEPDDVPS
jgi:crossover junction endodeoxyribonuclease RusA